jgi:hypothetical protein
MCPCTRCQCMASAAKFEVQNHLLVRGFTECFIMEGQSSSVAGVNPQLIVNDEAAGAPPDIGLLNKDALPNDVGLQNDGTPPDFVLDSEEGAPSDDRAATHTMIRSLIRGAIHGEIMEPKNEQLNKHAKTFFKLLKEAEKELCPGCTEATKVSFIVQLFQIKCMYGINNAALEAILNLFSIVLPKGHCIPDTMDKGQRVVRDLGLDYVKIHACENDYVLVWKENAELDTCPICKESRWKNLDDGAEKGVVDPAGTDASNNKKRLPRKILHYFPLTPRLQRIYMPESTSSEMRWHKEGLVSDGKMRHPADSEAWKHVDRKYEWFALDACNIRLGLASDGFNSFGMQNVTYTTWPVVLIPYNLPPWLC